MSWCGIDLKNIIHLPTTDVGQLTRAIEEIEEIEEIEGGDNLGETEEEKKEKKKKKDYEVYYAGLRQLHAESQGASGLLHKAIRDGDINKCKRLI